MGALKPSKCYKGLQSGDQSSTYTALEHNMTTSLPARAVEACEYEFINCGDGPAQPLYDTPETTSDDKPPLPPRNRRGISQVH